eukprot:Colp12_sorted_trinity150504_noHs@16213
MSSTGTESTAGGIAKNGSTMHRFSEDNQPATGHHESKKSLLVVDLSSDLANLEPSEVYLHLRHAVNRNHACLTQLKWFAGSKGWSIESAVVQCAAVLGLSDELNKQDEMPKDPLAERTETADGAKSQLEENDSRADSSSLCDPMQAVEESEPVSASASADGVDSEGYTSESSAYDSDMEVDVKDNNNNNNNNNN